MHPFFSTCYLRTDTGKLMGLFSQLLVAKAAENGNAVWSVNCSQTWKGFTLVRKAVLYTIVHEYASYVHLPCSSFISLRLPIRYEWLHIVFCGVNELKISRGDEWVRQLMAFALIGLSGWRKNPDLGQLHSFETTWPNWRPARHVRPDAACIQAREIIC
jgi:hypothetical protein